MEKIAIIDGDGLIYHACRENIFDSINEIDARMQNIFDKVSSKYILTLTISKFTFRNRLYPEYKANRKNIVSNLKWIKTLKNYLIEKYNAIHNFECEADDLVIYFKYQLGEKGVLCSPDKDILKNYEGTHFDYSYELTPEAKLLKGTEGFLPKEEDVIKGYWITTSKEEAERHFWYQMLAGDRGDNIKGLEGKSEEMITLYQLDKRKGLGEAAANKILNKIETDFDYQYYHKILECYVSYYGYDFGVEQFELNKRLLKMIDNKEDMFNFTNAFYDEAEKYVCEIQHEILDSVTPETDAF